MVILEYNNIPIVKGYTQTNWIYVKVAIGIREKGMTYLISYPYQNPTKAIFL